jgi:hypothetical protein
MSDDLLFIEKMEDPEKILSLIYNAQKRINTQNDERARKALYRSYNRLWQIIANYHAQPNTIEWELWYALTAYESALTEKNGKKTNATYLKRKIKKEDIFKAVCGAVMKGPNSFGFKKLAEMDRLDASFEEVVVRHPKEFPKDVVAQAKRSLAEYR